MSTLETDYLVIGSGAAGMAFADSLLTETDAHITIVDRHAKPGGHWNDAYPFVALHQPSAFYGVNSLALGADQKDTVGTNKGMFELATGAEVSSYFDRVMTQKLLPSGRVCYHPLSNYLGGGQIESILSGQKTQVTVRKKVVDAYYFGPVVPSTHTPRFAVAKGVNLVPPNDLVKLWQRAGQPFKRFVILGAGKTAMDTGVWLQNCGALAQCIHWVMPRDSWLINRATVQPGAEFFNESMGGQLAQMEAFAEASNIDDLFLRLEAKGQMLRIDTSHTPTMFHYATMSIGEIEVLRRIKNVHRMGRVTAIEPDSVVMTNGRLAIDSETLCIDCTASAVEPRAPQAVFQGNKIVLQIVRAPQPTFSAALIAYVEAHVTDEAQKNQLCGQVPFPQNLAGFAVSTAASMRNLANWTKDKALREWIRNSRLDGFSKTVAAVDPSDAQKMALLGQMRSAAMAAMGNIPKLLQGAAEAND